MNRSRIVKNWMMKTVLTLIVAIVMVTAGYGQKSANSWYKVTPVENLRGVNVFVENRQPEDFHLELRNHQGHVIWEADYKQKSLAKSILLEEFKNGRYVMSVTKGTLCVEQPFVLDENEAVIDKSEIYVASPTVAVFGKSVFVDFPANTMNEEVEVHIYNSDGIEEYTNEITTDSSRITKYDMSALAGGKYMMEFRVGDKRFTKNVLLNGN